MHGFTAVLKMPRLAILGILCVLTLWAGHAAADNVPVTLTPASLSAASDARWLQALGCHQRRAAPALNANARLDAAADRWAHGASLDSSLDRAGYQAERSAGLHVRGQLFALSEAVRGSVCRALSNHAYREVGLYAQGNELWILLAAPFIPPAQPGRTARQVLVLVNAARQTGHRCGRRRFGPAPPLQLDDRLTRAASLHARNMLERDYFAHDGPDGTPAQRVAATGYQYRLVGENIALGPVNAAQAVQGWLASPEHCENIMDPRFRQTGVAFAANHRGAPRIDWVQDFGTPAAPPTPLHKRRR
jgi:uncharacterized protein YkwD